MRQPIQGGCTQQSVTKNKNLGYSETGTVGLRNHKHKDGNKKCQNKRKFSKTYFPQINVN
jgi:hypothetical protein